ncbi:MAG: preprotein translocase subunit SecG [Chitinophagaceae bacterium]
MSILFVILVILASVVLALFVLIQNPKGGGLAGNIAGFSNQFMGVKQTTDVLEKGTWIFAGIIGVLCLISALFIRSGDGGDGLPNSIEKAAGAPAPASQAPANNTTTFPTAPAGDSVPK